MSLRWLTKITSQILKNLPSKIDIFFSCVAINDNERYVL